MNSFQTLDNVGKNRWIASQNPDQEVKECTGCVMSCDHDDYGIIYNFLIGYYCWVALALDTEQTSHEILFRKSRVLLQCCSPFMYKICDQCSNLCSCLEATVEACEGTIYWH